MRRRSAMMSLVALVSRALMLIIGHEQRIRLVVSITVGAAVTRRRLLVMRVGVATMSSMVARDAAATAATTPSTTDTGRASTAAETESVSVRAAGRAEAVAAAAAIVSGHLIVSSSSAAT